MSPIPINVQEIFTPGPNFTNLITYEKQTQFSN